MYVFTPLQGSQRTVYKAGSDDAVALLQPRVRSHDTCLESQDIFDLFHNVLVSAAKEILPKS